MGTVRTSETQREGKNMAEAAMAEWSGDSGVEEEEGEEEPLFADDLEDLPPLPPPMPSLSQLQAKSNVCSYQFNSLPDNPEFIDYRSV